MVHARVDPAGAEAVAPELGPAAAALSIVGVCRTLPTPEDPVAGTFVLHRLAALARLADVRVVQPVPYFPLAKPLPAWSGAPHTAQGLSIEPAPMFYLPGVLKSLDGRWLARSTQRALARLARARRIDLIDAHFGYPEGAGCVRAGRALGLPVFVTIRGSETDLLALPGIGAQLVQALNAAAGCISVSHTLARLAVRHGVDERRLRVIPNAIDRSLFRPGSREAARRELGIDARAPLIVAVGHLVAGKRHHVLVRALAGLRRRYPRAQLAIVGGAAYERSYPQELERLTREAGVAEQVRMLGRIAQLEVNTWLQAADVFALATHREGCCNAVLEALAAGRPVVTTPVGDNPQFVHEGVNGALVPVDDVVAFERALESALGRSWDAQAIARGLEVGDWEDVARRVLGFFRERLAEARVTRGAARV